MKIKKILFSIIILSLVCVFAGCGYRFARSSKIVIIDYETNDVVAQFYTEDDEVSAVALTELLNNTEDITENVYSSPEYTVHFVDPKNSEFDVWYFIYLENDSLYMQYDTDKMNGMDDDIKKCTSMTPNEFMSIINNH
jgi:hypothetical protein